MCGGCVCGQPRKLTVPDVPVGTFELTLPQGPYSALTANRDLCKTKLAMPTEFLGQNGALVKTNTKIATTGCTKARKAAHKKRARPHKRPKKRVAGIRKDARPARRTPAPGRPKGR